MLFWQTAIDVKGDDADSDTDVEPIIAEEAEDPAGPDVCGADVTAEDPAVDDPAVDDLMDDAV